VVRDAAFDAQTKRAELSWVEGVRVAPDARIPVASRGIDTEASCGVDHGLLQGSDERPQQDAALGELDDRVGNQLARAVVRHFAATLNANNFDTAACQLFVTGQNVGSVRVAAERQHGRMFEQQQLIRNLVGTPLRDQVVLKVPRVAIGDLPQPTRLQPPGLS